MMARREPARSLHKRDHRVAKPVEQEERDFFIGGLRPPFVGEERRFCDINAGDLDPRAPCVGAIEAGQDPGGRSDLEGDKAQDCKSGQGCQKADMPRAAGRGGGLWIRVHDARTLLQDELGIKKT